MNSQTFVKTIEQSFEKVRQEDASTLAQAVSNELMRTMPRLSPELFERTRTADITLSDEQKKETDGCYGSFNFSVGLVRYKDTDLKSLNLTRMCSAEIPIFAYARVPEQTEVIQEGAGIIKYTYIETIEGGIHKALHFARYCLNRPDASFYMCFNFESCNSNSDSDNSNSNKWYGRPGHSCGNSILELKAVGSKAVEFKHVWTAPPKHTLDVCVAVPDVIDSVAELTDTALLQYYQTVAALKSKSSRKHSLAKPSLGILWALDDKVLYCTGDIPKPANPDPALILEIPDEDKSYRHVIAMWDIEEERPFRNWLAEYSEP